MFCASSSLILDMALKAPKTGATSFRSSSLRMADASKAHWLQEPSTPLRLRVLTWLRPKWGSEFRLQVSGFGVQDQGLGFRVWECRCLMHSPAALRPRTPPKRRASEPSKLQFTMYLSPQSPQVWCPELRVKGLGYKGIGFRV